MEDDNCARQSRFYDCNDVKTRSASSDRDRMRNRISQSQSTPNFRKLDAAHKSNPTLVKGDFMPKPFLDSRNFRHRAAKMTNYHSSGKLAPSFNSNNRNEAEFQRSSFEHKETPESPRFKNLTLNNIRDLLLNKTRERLFISNKTSSHNTNLRYYDKSRCYRNSSSPKKPNLNLSVFKPQTERKLQTQSTIPNIESDVTSTAERDENEPYNGSPYRRPGGFGSMPKSRSYHAMKSSQLDDYFFTLAAQMSVARETDL